MTISKYAGTVTWVAKEMRRVRKNKMPVVKYGMATVRRELTGMNSHARKWVTLNISPAQHNYVASVFNADRSDDVATHLR